MKVSEKKRLNDILWSLLKVNNFMMKESTVIIVKSRITSDAESSYTNKLTGETFHSFTKEIGCDLCYLQNAITKLTDLIEEQ